MVERVTISITDKETDQPIIEVVAPSYTSRPQFKIGNGYAANLDQRVGHYSYFIMSNNGLTALYYLPHEEWNGPIDVGYVLQIRDAGALISFYNDRVCTNTMNCIFLSDCRAE